MCWATIVAWAILICDGPGENCERWAQKCLVKQFVLLGDADLAFEWCAENIPVEVINASTPR
jgi:hypothetical protein